MTMIRNKIRKRRQELNMSRVQLAEAVQVTPSAIANYENGISYPKPDIFVALMITLEVDANYFYEEYVRNREIAIACKRAITQDEIYALEKYRQLTSSGKKLVRMVIEEEYSRMQQEDGFLFEWIFSLVAIFLTLLSNSFANVIVFILRSMQINCIIFLLMLF